MQPRTAPHIPDELRTMRVLIVDDEQVNVTVMEGILNQAGFYQTRGVLDSREALQAYQEFRPDLVLLDLMMPWVDGYTVLEEIRAASGAEAFLPVMVLTADTMDATRRRALAAGASDFLNKPISSAECLLRIVNLLTTRRLHLQLAAQNAGLEERVRERTAALHGALVQLRAAQQQIVQRERLSALGSMVTGIAHDFNNSLALILGYGERLQRECRTQSLEGMIPECAQTIITAASDAAEMVARLRLFYRPAGPQDSRAPVDLNDIVEQAIAFTRPRWQVQSLERGVPIECVSELVPAPPLQGSAAELREMMTNLIFNAVDAMPQGGTITIRTAVRGDRVLLQVRDVGTGMSEDVKRRCLEPFFSTKGARGAGLGLAMVYGIVQRHGGTVQIESTLGFGTTFTFTFPVDPNAAVRPLAPAAENSQPLRILVVDDQPILTEILAEMLARDWHTVTTATNGRTALELFTEGDFDLVITDKAMPEMNGDQLAVAIKARAPEVPVLMLTGFGDFAEGGEEVSEFVDGVLIKPARASELRSAVARLVAKTKKS